MIIAQSVSGEAGGKQNSQTRRFFCQGWEYRMSAVQVCRDRGAARKNNGDGKLTTLSLYQGEFDDLSNLQPLQWENNRHQGDNYPDWTCKVKS